MVRVRQKWSTWVTGWASGCLLGWVGVSEFGAAQEPEQPTIQRASPTSQANPSTSKGFPIEWFGTWKGTVRSQKPNGASHEFQMELTIAATDTENEWQWKIVYEGPQGKSEWDYRLLKGDLAGEFVIDERNGIRIDAVLFENTLCSQFAVRSQSLSNQYELRTTDGKPEIHFELVSLDATNPTTTSAAGGGSEFAVDSFKPSNRQYAALKRVETLETPNANSELPTWRKLETEAYRGKQDDIAFVNERIGWYVNGEGKVYKTIDGGETWRLQWHHPGSYLRCLAFLDEQHGFLGNIGPGYFPNVTDAVPLYETKDGGDTWNPVTGIDGPPVVGLCALQVLREPFVNAGQLEMRTRLIGVGRVGGPAAMIVSDDLGATWQQVDIASHAAMAFDVHFFNRNEGFIAAASHADVAQSNAVILATSDGGKSWHEAYRSDRPYELTWKISFPTREVGYVTIQSYDPDPSAKDRFVAKTTDGGRSWTEIPMSSDPRVREFGVAFLDPLRGWVGAVPHGFQTIDGGASWTPAAMGNAVNKIRLIPTEAGHVGFAIGTQVHRIDVPKAR